MYEPAFQYCVHKYIYILFTGGQWGYHREGSCQAGYSVALAEVSASLMPNAWDTCLSK